ncbi:hypothetical protein DFS33DRAFT_1387770 [Desarmillaria ectypa]|nr:hypothetical protein DFS33DRAFT_1387770 [Desarmillaria ectypa]
MSGFRPPNTWKCLTPQRTMCMSNLNNRDLAVRSALTEKTFSHRVRANLRFLLTSLCSFTPSKKEGWKAQHNYLLNLANASEESLRDLNDTADAAGFGPGNQNVSDETYRKSKELDTSRFPSNFDTRATKIFEQVQADLIGGQDEVQRPLKIGNGTDWNHR